MSVENTPPDPTCLDLDALAALEAAATPGPWTAHSDGLVWPPGPGDPVSGPGEQANADLIAAARNALPGLLAEVRRLTAELAKVTVERAAAVDGSLAQGWDRVAAEMERDAAQARLDELAAELARVTAERDDALQVVADLGGAGTCGTTTDSLVGHAPFTCELTAGHIGWHRTSDGSTFTERGAAGVGEPRTRLLVWDCGEQPDLAELRQAIADLSGGRLHMAEASHTGTQDYAILLSDQPVTEAQASEAYRQREADQ